MKTKVAVILSGCGVYDGSEIYETVLTLLALARADAEVTCLAPDIAHKHIIDHSTGDVMVDDDRNVMVEAARLARGEIEPLDNVKGDDFDAVIFVGGFGVAKNLSSYAFDGSDYDADAGVIDFIQDAHAKGIPQGFMCIAPVLAARALGEQHVVLTVGQSGEVASALEAKGAKHLECKVDDIILDQGNRIVTTPAYMLAGSILEAEAGINRLVEAVLQLVKQR